MTDHGHIEPYNREGGHASRSHSYEPGVASRGNSLEKRKDNTHVQHHNPGGYNRHSQERRYHDKFENHGVPHQSSSRQNLHYEKQYREEYVPANFGNAGQHEHHLSHSRSPSGGRWNHDSHSPHDVESHGRYPTSPLRS